ncbi:hypothetical protein VSS74_12845 [Conexibacter stalactiti]|uniref:Uncharacterized protein n=1 Tax=Conexibacter stalactiti TaxID=1940611 RepID=A0ABU4HPL7_9ACTN|nr:hypothetical protein [Conexibacter stalactiti]MDW5595231.1 hypothetical protein [Conexibacter stalactiti]MEC5035873.1 hypothetical protein [Conexibacter stalactiti]
MTPVEAPPSQPSPDPAPAAPRRRAALTIAIAVVVVALVVAAVALFAGGDDDDTPPRAPASAATPARLATVAAGAGHPVYWAGARDATTYELTRTSDGRIFVRYLPEGVAVGDPAADYLTVASYPQRSAYAALLATARRKGASTVAVPGGGRGYQDPDRATSAYVAFPGSDVQVEVFDPAAGAALRAVQAGAIVPVDAGAARSSEPRAATPAQLAAAGRAHGHPVYWAGPVDGATYELTEASDGRVYVRYLSGGAAVGDAGDDHLTVGTYPQPDALGELRRAAAASGAETFAVDGGTAFADPAHPGSVYVAYRDSGVQVEVYDPLPGRARALLTGGDVVPAG